MTKTFCDLCDDEIPADTHCYAMKVGEAMNIDCIDLVPRSDVGQIFAICKVCIHKLNDFLTAKQKKG